MMNSRKKVTAALNTFKKKLNQSGSMITQKYRDGELDLMIELDGEVIDISDKLIDLLVISEEVMESLKEKLNQIRSDTDLYVIKDAFDSAQDTIDKIYSKDISKVTYFDNNSGEQLKILAKSQHIDVAEIIELATFSALHLCMAELKRGVYLTNSVIFNNLIWLYIIIKNGGLEGVKDIGILDKIIDIDEKMVKGVSFEDYCVWLEGFKINTVVLKNYIKYFYEEERNIDTFRIFIVSMAKEYADVIKDDGDSWELKEIIEKTQNGIMKDVKNIYGETKEEESESLRDLVVGIKLIFSDGIGSDLIAEALLAFGMDELYSDYAKEISKKYSGVLNICMTILNAIASTGCGMVDDLSDRLEKLTADYDKLKGMNRKYKSDLKRTEKELKETKAQLVTQKNKNEKQIAYIEGLRNKGISDVEPYRKQIESIKNSLSSREEEVVKLKKAYSKMNNANEELRVSNRNILLQLEKANQQISELNEKVLSTASNFQGNGIPLECYIRAIRNKKIALFGGNMMHTELKQLGFRNLRLFEASNRGMSFSDLAHQDLIVVVTGYMSHSTMHIPKGASDKYGVPIYYFNNKNVQMLIQEMFAVFFGDGYKSLKDSKNNVVC